MALKKKKNPLRMLNREGFIRWSAIEEYIVLVCGDITVIYSPDANRSIGTVFTNVVEDLLDEVPAKVFKLDS